MVLWTLFRTRRTKKHLFQNRKFAQSGLREVLTLQSSLSAKAAVGASMLCLQKQVQPSPGFESVEQGGHQYASQEMTYHAARHIPRTSEVVDLTRCACPNQLVFFSSTDNYSFQVIS